MNIQYRKHEKTQNTLLCLILGREGQFAFLQNFHNKKQQNSAYEEENKTKPISAQELDGLQYLAGYVVHKFIKKTRNNKNYNSKIN